LPKVIRERLFQPFSTAEKPAGTGLGLSIAKELSMAMGGDIALKETNENGTVFSLTLRQTNPAS